MRALVCFTALLAVASAGHQAPHRAHSSGSHGSTYAYSLPSGHVRVSNYAKSHKYTPVYRPAPLRVHRYHAPHKVTKYVPKPVVKVVEVPKVVVKHVPKPVVKIVEVPTEVIKHVPKPVVKIVEVPQVVVKHVPKVIVKEVPQIVYKEVPKVVVKEIEVPRVVYKHVPVTHEVKIATPVVKTVHAAPAVQAYHPAPAAVAAPLPVVPAPQAYHAAPVAAYHAAPAAAYHAAPAAAYHAAPMAVGAAYPYAAPISSQFHAQDELGQYDYGYANPSSSKQEVKTLDGVTRGGFSYVDANGQTQVASYYSDATGFHIARTDLPVAPVAPEAATVALPEAVAETEEVAAAREAHLKAHAEALAASTEEEH